MRVGGGSRRYCIDPIYSIGSLDEAKGEWGSSMEVVGELLDKMRRSGGIRGKKADNSKTALNIQCKKKIMHSNFPPNGVSPQSH